MGGLTLICGPSIQPVLLILNGVVFAQVPTYFMKMMDSLDPSTIITFLLRVMSGLSVGTVGIQNMEFQSVLQGGVLASALFAKVVRTPAKEWIEKTFDGNTFGKFLDGMFKEYGLMGLDLVSTGVGAFLATGFKALTKIGNSAYLASALFVDGVFDLGENYILEWFELESIPPVTEGLAWRTLFKNLVFIFSIYWHSLLLSRKKVKDFERSSGKRKLGM